MGFLFYSLGILSIGMACASFSIGIGKKRNWNFIQTLGLSFFLSGLAVLAVDFFVLK